MTETVTGHWQCKEQSSLDKEQEGTGDQGRKGLLLTFRGEGGEKSCPRSHGEPRAPSLRASHFTPAGDTPGAPLSKNPQAGGKGKEGEAAFGLNPLPEMTNEGQTCKVYQLNES